MIALAVLGIAVVSVFQLFSVSLRSTKKAEDYTKAVFYARSLLDEAYSLKEPEDIPDIVTLEEGYKGSREIALKSSDKDDKVKLYEITVVITMPTGGSFSLKGLRTIHEEKK